MRREIAKHLKICLCGEHPEEGGLKIDIYKERKEKMVLIFLSIFYFNVVSGIKL